MQQFDLTIERARTVWTQFTGTSQYSEVANELRRAITLEGTPDMYIDETIIRAPRFVQLVNDNLLNGLASDPSVIARNGTIADSTAFIRRYLDTALAAFSVLAMARPMQLVIGSPKRETVRHYNVDDLSEVIVPDSVYQKTVNPYVYKPQQMFLDLFTVKQFLSGRDIFKWTQHLLDLQSYFDRRKADKSLSIEVRAYYAALSASLSVRGTTQGQPRGSHNCVERPAEYASDPSSEDYRKAYTEAAQYLASLYKPRLLQHRDILEHQSTTPIDSAIGNWLYEPNADIETRVRRMVMLGLLGDKFTSASDVEKTDNYFSSIAREYGYTPFHNFRTAGIRVMAKGGKPEWLNDSITDFRFCPFDAYTVACTFRLRLVFAEGQINKARFKRPADILKSCSFKLSDVASVDVKLQEWKIAEIGRRCMRDRLYFEEDGDIFCYCASDASGWDRTVGFSLMESSYTFLRALGIDLPQDAYYEILANVPTILPSTLDGRGTTLAYNSTNKIVASGESFVTAKNNIIHTIIYYCALRAVSDLSFAEITKRLENHTWILCVHGDDLLRYFGPDPDFYKQIDAWIKGTGIHVAYEHVPVFLKKFLAPSGHLTGDWASMIKNIKGENPKSHLAVLMLGCIARLKGHVDPDERARLMQTLNLMTSYCSDYRVQDVGLDEQLQYWSDRLAAFQLKHPARSLAYRHELESLYYTQGETMPNEQLDTIYGAMKVDYVNSEVAQMYAAWNLDQLLDAIGAEQRQILDHERMRRRIRG